VAASDTGPVGGSSNSRLAGRIKWFDQAKGYGFVSVRLPEPEDVLFHISVLRQFGIENVTEEDWLEFLAVSGPKGKHVETILSYKLSSRSTQPYEPVIVKWFDATKGFGFVRRVDDPTDVFIHASVVRRAGLAGLEPDMALKVRIQSGAKGQHVHSIQRP
jgi:CspA family cold shock protein